MNHILRTILLLTITLIAFGRSDGQTATPAMDINHLTDSLYRELANATTAADSLPIMGNLFDLLPHKQGTPVGLEMFDVANRAKNASVALEILRNLSNRYIRNDSMLVDLYERTLRYTKLGNENLNASLVDELRETRTLIRLTRNMHRARYASPEERRHLLMELLQTTEHHMPTSIYDRIVLQHSICMILSNMGASDILSHEMDKLGDMINEVPASAVSIHNAYNVYAAMIYTETGEYEKAMQADRRTLDGIETLERRYHSAGRVFRNYDANRYIIYTRILANYPILAPNEVEKYYALAMEMAARSQTAKRTNEVFPGPQIYYNLSYGNHAKALALIKSCIENPYNSTNRTRLLKEAIHCAEALGDKESLLTYTTDYNKRLEEELSLRLDVKYRELQILADNSEMTSKYNRLQAEKQRSEARGIHIIMAIAIIAAIILLVSVIILYRLNTRNRQLVDTLNRSNRELTEKSQKLEKSRQEIMQARDQAQKANNLKTDFIKNMSYEVKAPLNAIAEYSRLIVDCADASNRKYLSRFTSLLELNSELLTTIVNDVLHLSEIDSNSVPIHNSPTDLQRLCSMVLEGVRNRLKPGVSLLFDADSPSMSLITDPQRLHQILLNLLTNAAKFTDSGSITLSYRLDPEGRAVTFSVTDTGIGINPEKSEDIFERFVKLDKETQGAGLGLTISRMLAELMGGELTLDTSYTSGARFLLTLPIK
ncbi:MAG: HAMP domain-containing histidine kinase [Bacteroides sp.]|nr:HAMP domain-containing histidine kinase [Bacteroides sp.]